MVEREVGIKVENQILNAPSGQSPEGAFKEGQATGRINFILGEQVGAGTDTVYLIREIPIKLWYILVRSQI